MKKLLHLKKWLTVEDAARHLEILFGESVTEADVYRLALEGHLTLSVNFVNHVYGHCGYVVTKEHIKKLCESSWAKNAITPFDEVVSQLENTLLGTMKHEGEPKLIDGIWDLSMEGAEVRDVEERYQRLTGGPPVEPLTVEGPLLRRDDGTYCTVMDKFEFTDPERKKKGGGFFPAYGLPADGVLVVRTSALQAFEARLSEPSQQVQKPVERRERNTLLLIVAALCKLAKIEMTKASAAATVIENETVRMGARVAARTIENHLKLIPEALEARSS